MERLKRLSWSKRKLIWLVSVSHRYSPSVCQVFRVEQTAAMAHDGGSQPILIN